MLSAKFWTRCVVLTCLMFVGCQPNDASKSSNSSEDGGAALPADKSGKKKIVPVKRDVKEIEGNWVFVLTRNQMDSYRWVLNFSRGSDGKIKAEFIDFVQDKDEKEKPEIVSTDVDGDLVEFKVKTAHGPFEFSGVFQQGFIRGTVRSTPAELLLARLLPTDVKSLEQYSFTGRPPGTDRIDEIMKSKDFHMEHLLATLHEFRTSPVAQDMYLMMISNHVQAKLDEAKLNHLITEFLETAKMWGKRWEAYVELSVGISLVKGRHFTRVALVHLDAAEKLMGDDLPVFQKTIEAFRDMAKVNELVLTLTEGSASDETKAASYQELNELRKTHQHIPEILNALSVYAEQSGQTDAAIDDLSEIVALPLLEGMILQHRAGQPPSTPIPSDVLKKLWKQKHGSEDGLSEHLEQVYHKAIDEMTAEMKEHAPPLSPDKLGNKVVLAELFTGMQCPPCIAADLGLTGVSKTYPSDHFVALRFHQHIPLPDGLVNQDSEERAAFYEVSGTPTVMVDGIPLDQRFYAGPLVTAGPAYVTMRRVVDAKIVEKTDVAIQLKAEVVDDQLTASAEVTGIPEDLLQSCRLRLAVVENNVYAFAPLSTNGIREHEFLVREMLGGAKGIPPKKGELKYAVTIPLAEIKQHVVDYITRFEAGRRAEFPAGLKPPVRGPLSLVAWVQSGSVVKETNSKPVLQAAMIPIAGTGESGATVQPSTTSTVETPKKDETPKKEPAVESKAATAGSAPGTPPPPALPE